MATFAALRMTATRRVMPLAARNTQRRNMGLGGHSGPPPEWEGVDKVVRGVFPHDYQLAMAILGGYTGIYVMYSISSSFSSKKKVEKAPEPKAAPAVSSEGIPSVESPEFVAFLESDSFLKLLESEEQLKAMTEA